MSIEIPTATTALALGDKVNVDDRMHEVIGLAREANGFAVTLRDEYTGRKHTIDLDPVDVDTPVWMVENN